VFDGLTGAPVAQGAIVDATGCPLDSDKDGVPDGLDKCPNTPPGAEVDDVGCQRFKDSDGTGGRREGPLSRHAPGTAWTPPAAHSFHPGADGRSSYAASFSRPVSPPSAESFTVLDIVDSR